MHHVYADGQRVTLCVRAETNKHTHTHAPQRYPKRYGHVGQALNQ